jgi:hypothetical protein
MADDDIILGAQRRYPNGQVRQAGTEPQRPMVPGVTTPVVNQGVTTMRGQIEISVAIVENGYMATFDGKTYIANDSIGLADIIAKSIEASCEVVIPGGAVEVGGDDEDISSNMVNSPARDE